MPGVDACDDRVNDARKIPNLLQSKPATTFSGMSANVTEVEIWNRAIRPDAGGFSAAAATEFLGLRLAEADQQRARELSSKANSGTLNSEETQELDYYLNVGRALEFLKAKARLSLRDAAA